MQNHRDCQKAPLENQPQSRRRIKRRQLCPKGSRAAYRAADCRARQADEQPPAKKSVPGLCRIPGKPRPRAASIAPAVHGVRRERRVLQGT